MRFGAQFARVIMAISVSTVMTSTVVAPMAVQAHTARSIQSGAELTTPIRKPGTSVLGKSTTRPAGDVPNEIPTVAPAIAARGIYYAPVAADAPPEPAHELDGATVTMPAYLIVSLPEEVYVEFFIDGDRVELSSLPPWNLYLGAHIDPAEFDAGTHHVRAEVTGINGVTDTLVASFTTLRR